MSIENFPIYSNSSNIGSVSGGGGAPGVMGNKAVIRTGRYGLGGQTGGDKGGVGIGDVDEGCEGVHGGG